MLSSPLFDRRIRVLRVRLARLNVVRFNRWTVRRKLFLPVKLFARRSSVKTLKFKLTVILPVNNSLSR